MGEGEEAEEEALTAREDLVRRESFDFEKRGEEMERRAQALVVDDGEMSLLNELDEMMGASSFRETAIVVSLIVLRFERPH